MSWLPNEFRVTWTIIGTLAIAIAPFFPWLLMGIAAWCVTALWE